MLKVMIAEDDLMIAGVLQNLAISRRRAGSSHGGRGRLATGRGLVNHSDSGPPFAASPSIRHAKADPVCRPDERQGICLFGGLRRLRDHLDTDGPDLEQGRAAMGLLEIGDQSPQDYSEYYIGFMNGFADVLSEVVSPSSKRNADLQVRIEGMSGFIVDRLHLSADMQRAETAKGLAPKERLVVTQEFQHRVRNNLQVVYGMLIGQLQTATEPSAKEGISAILRCVITLGRVYDHLLGTGIGEKIDFGSYLSWLCSSFAEMEDPKKPKVLLTCQTTQLMLELDTVTALGLMVAEFISNSYLHAFPNGKGTISVTLLIDRSRDEGTIVFADDGVGFDDSGDEKRAGLGIVRRLVKQINGSVDHQSGGGSVGTGRFPLPVGATNDDESAVPIARLLGSDLPVLDHATLERTAKLLKPGAALLRGLRAPDAFTGTDATLADTAHQLAGTCGMLGFERLAYVARLFEDAARIAPTKATTLGDDIAAARATIEEIDARMAVDLRSAA